MPLSEREAAGRSPAVRLRMPLIAEPAPSALGSAAGAGLPPPSWLSSYMRVFSNQSHMYVITSTFGFCCVLCMRGYGCYVLQADGGGFCV